MLKYNTVKKPDISDLKSEDLLIKYCFGQKGEDYLVNLIFENKNNGTYIDVGGHDGVRFSNTFAFSKLGWKGAIVEAHPDYYRICYKRINLYNR